MQLGVSAYGWGHVAKFRKFALTMQKQTGPAQGVWQSKLWVLDIVAMNDTFLRRTTNTLQALMTGLSLVLRRRV